MASIKRRHALVAAVALTGIAQGTSFAADPLRVTQPVQVTKSDLDPQRTYAAPYLLAHPDDPEVIVGGTLEFRQKQCSLVRSTNGGTTWTLLDNPPLLQSHPFCLANNSNIFQAPLAWGRAERLYMATVAWDVQDTRSKSSVALHRSSDLGDSWESFIVRDARPTSGDDQESNRPVTGVVVDSSGSEDVVYVTWRQGISNQPTGSSVPSHAMVAVSTDGGETFGPPRRIDEGAYTPPVVSEASSTATTVPNTTTTTAPAGSLAERPDAAENFGSGNNGVAMDGSGTFYAAWPSSSSNQGGRRVATGIFLSSTSDRGQTWRHHPIRSFRFENRSNVQLAWSSDGGPNGSLHVVYEGTDQPDVNSYADIWHQRSTDGGQTWSEPTSITGSNPRDLFGKFIPMITTAPNGRIDVAWWDTRDDPGIRANDVYYTYSTDAGETFVAPTRITDQSIDRRFGVWGNNFDQNSPPGLASVDEYAIVGWDDTRFSRGEDGPVLATDPATSGAGVGGGLQDIFVSTVQFSAVGGGASKVAKAVMAGVVGLVAVGLVLLVVSSLSRRSGEPPRLMKGDAAKSSRAPVG